MLTLEDYLDGFSGCLVVVSHDRYFLDRTVEHIFRFEGEGRVRQYPGNYAAFLEARGREEREAVSVAPLKALNTTPTEPVKSPTVKTRLSFKERKELEELEARIQTTERRQVEIETELTANASDAYLVHQLYEERETLTAQLARDLDRWSELAELT